MDSNPLAGLVGFWMVMQLIAVLALLLGGIYLLYSLGRAAAGMERMADAFEDWVALQQPANRGDELHSSPSGSPLPVVPPAVSSEPTPILEKDEREHDVTKYPS